MKWSAGRWYRAIALLSMGASFMAVPVHCRPIGSLECLIPSGLGDDVRVRFKPHGMDPDHSEQDAIGRHANRRSIKRGHLSPLTCDLNPLPSRREVGMGRPVSELPLSARRPPSFSL